MAGQKFKIILLILFLATIVIAVFSAGDFPNFDQTSTNAPVTLQPTPEPEPPPPTPSDVLESDRGVDYSRLQELLSQKQWKEADQETFEVTLKATNQESERWLTIESIKAFPCTDLGTIDQLWVKYSDGRFGFSIQKQIYQDSGAQLDGQYPVDREIWREFGDRVGWRKAGAWKGYHDLEWSPGAPEIAPRGHLPPNGYPRALSALGRRAKSWYFSQRTVTCSL